VNDEPNVTSDDDIDPGEPIEDLAGFEEETGDGFLSRIRGRINRRMLASQSVDLNIKFFMDTVRDYILVIFEVFQGAGKKGTRE
jgi:hypothetical protein